jgi:hypothetical protein
MSAFHRTESIALWRAFEASENISDVVLSPMSLAKKAMSCSIFNMNVFKSTGIMQDVVRVVMSVESLIHRELKSHPVSAVEATWW